MTTGESVTERTIVESVGSNAYYVTDGTIVATVATQGGAWLELRMNVAAARQLVERLQEQIQLLKKYRDESGPAEQAGDQQDIIASLGGAD
jgi:hypothetical protein